MPSGDMEQVLTVIIAVKDRNNFFQKSIHMHVQHSIDAHATREFRCLDNLPTSCI